MSHQEVREFKFLRRASELAELWQIKLGKSWQTGAGIALGRSLQIQDAQIGILPSHIPSHVQEGSELVERRK